LHAPHLERLGGDAAHDAKANETVGLASSALTGVFFGLVFGGVRGKWLGKVFGPEGDEEDSPTAPPYASRFLRNQAFPRPSI
jgi:hypothetical protein